MIAWCVVNNMMQSLPLACAQQSPRVTPNYASTHTPQFILMKMMIFGQYGSIFKHSFLVAGTPRKISGPRARDVMSLLEMQLVLVSGGGTRGAGPPSPSPPTTRGRRRGRRTTPSCSTTSPSFQGTTRQVPSLTCLWK